jgi:hypothetical protein
MIAGTLFQLLPWEHGLLLEVLPKHFPMIQEPRLRGTLRNTSPGLLKLDAFDEIGAGMENFIHFSHEVASWYRLLQ